MCDTSEFSLELVKQFLLDKGGKVTNHELVKHFKGYLNDPVNKADIRHRFKDYVNTLASVKDEGGTKFLLLKKEYYSELHSYLQRTPSPLNTVSESYCDSTPSLLHSELATGCNVSPGSQVAHVPPWVPSSQEQIMLSDECSSPISLTRYQSSPSLVDTQETYKDSPPPLPKKKHSFDESPRRLDVPHPPPRGRKNHGRRGSQVEERVRQFSTEKELGGGGDGNFKDKNLQDVTVSPGTVKEKTQIINRMSESNLLAVKQPITHASVGPKRRDNGARTAADDDTTSVSTLDPRRREWLLRAAQADYHALARLLLEDAELYMFEDFTSGYTALHWAAKHGNAEIVKLIAGTYGLSANVKSHGGYTPLHLAAMFQHRHIIELLTTTYGADPNIRDHSGRKAEHYLAGVGSLYKNGGKRTQQPPATGTTEKDLGFMRMGSFNSRVKRTAAALTGSFGSQKLKPWGSADSVMDSTVCVGMFPPKHTVKKKKSKKIELPSSSSVESLKSKLSITPSLDSDSDSTCGFPS